MVSCDLQLGDKKNKRSLWITWYSYSSPMDKKRKGLQFTESFPTTNQNGHFYQKPSAKKILLGSSVWRDIFFVPRRKDPTATPRSFPRCCARETTSHGRRLAEGSEWRCRLAWLSSCWDAHNSQSMTMGLIYLPCSNIMFHYLQKNINHSGKYTSVLWIRPGIVVDPPQVFLPDAFRKWLDTQASFSDNLDASG